MLPRNIDLTAHSDFNDHEVFTIANVRRLRNSDGMSLDEWNVLQWWDSIFGKKGHPNRNEHIFSPIKRWERRIPWEPIRTSIGIRYENSPDKDGYGDYMIMSIDENGQIANWNLSDLLKWIDKQ